MRYHIETHQNYSLATVTDSTAQVVVVYISIDTHQENSLATQAVGLMYSDALLSGAGTYDRAAFLDAVNQLGASISVKVTDGVVTITLRSTSATFKKLLALVETMLREPLFPKQEITRIRQTTRNALHESKEDSKTIAHERLRNAFYSETDRRYTHDIDETITAVDTIDAKDLRRFHAMLAKQSWICSIAGQSALHADFEKSLKRLRTEATITAHTATHQQKQPKPMLLTTNIPSRSNIDFSIGAPIPFTLHHPDYVPLAFAVAVLAKWGGFAGRLMGTVREKEGLTYGIYGKLESFSGSEQGYWRIMTFFAPEKSVAALTSTFREIKKLHQDGITHEEFERFQAILASQQVLLNDSLTSLLLDLHGYHFQGFTIDEIEAHKARIKNLTMGEVNTVIKRYLDPRTLTVSGAGPTKAVEKDLKRFLADVA